MQGMWEKLQSTITLAKIHRVNSEEKPYKCVKCRKDFAQTSHMVDHQRIHTGERPCVCTMCGKGSIQMSQ